METDDAEEINAVDADENEGMSVKATAHSEPGIHCDKIEREESCGQPGY